MLCVGGRMGVAPLLRILSSWEHARVGGELRGIAQVLLEHASTVLNLHPVHESPSCV